MPVYQLSEELIFPPPNLASKEGLLAIGGDLSLSRLLLAYSRGIFPWYSGGEPILWWSPDPRFVLYPPELRVARSLHKVMKKGSFRVTLDRDFKTVITECARVRREKDEGTWIVNDMIGAYCQLHESGFAHSVETWQDGQLAGGLYGVSLGKIFFGESMFTRISNASKVALVALVQHLIGLNFTMIDCQVVTAHLGHFGARPIPRKRFLQELNDALQAPTLKGRWRFFDRTVR